jgi:hypothetical protein
MKTKTKKFDGITVWVDNRVDQKVFITAGVLATRFNYWIKTKELDWLEYYWFEAACRSFLTDKAPGCQGVFEEKEFNGAYNFLKPIAESYMKSNGR